MSELTPELIAQKRFTTAFRGFEPDEVRHYLEAVSGHVAHLEARVRVLEVDLIECKAAASDAVAGAQVMANVALGSDGSTPPAEAALIVKADAEKVLRQARDEASMLVARANEEAGRIILRARAESRGKAGGPEGTQFTGMELPDDPEAARQAARAMVAEARAVRERILTDLAKRRRTAHVQLEQLRVARERLLESMRETRRVIDGATRDLTHVETEARLAAEAAGRKLAAEPMPTAEEMGIELLGGNNQSLLSMRSGDRERTGEMAGERAGVMAGETAGPEPTEIEPTMTAEPTAELEVAGDVTGDVTGVIVSAPEIGAPETMSAPEEPVHELEFTHTPDDATVEMRRPEVIVEHALAVEAARIADSSEPVADVTGSVDMAERDAVTEVSGSTEAAEAELVGAEPHEVVVVDEVAVIDVVDAVEREATDATGATDATDAVDLIEIGEADGETDDEGHAPVADSDGGRSGRGGRRQRASVDDLFARLRAERETASAHARTVLKTSGSVAVMERPASSRSDEHAVIDLVESTADSASELSSELTAGLSSGLTLEPNESNEQTEISTVVVPDNASALATTEHVDQTPAPLADDMTLVESVAASSDVVSDLPAEQIDEDALLAARDAQLSPIVDATVRQLRRIVQDEQSSALVALRSSRVRPGLDALLGDIDSHTLRFAGPIHDGVDLALIASGAEPDVVRAQMSTSVGELLDELVTLRRAGLAAVLELDGVSTDSIGEALRAGAREWSTERITNRVTDVMAAAFSVGTFSVTAAGARIRWVLDDGATSCSECDDNVLADGTVAGDSFPTGHLHPPAHRGCRCVVVPVG
jgi:DivIVA domain-containing protein